MPVSLKGKNALVTGAAVGLGNAFAKALAAQGANVAICDVRSEVDDVAKELAQKGVRTKAFRADVSVPADVRRTVEGTLSAFGRIDILVSNAGVWGPSVATDDLDKTLADYDRIFGTNLKGVYLFGRAVIPHMIAQKSGEIINVATDHMVTCGAPNHICPKLPKCPWKDAPRRTGGGPAMDIYDAAKWGINGLTFGWSKALRAHNIRVNAFCMGATDSYMLRSFHNFKPSQEEVDSWMKAEDTARVLVELLQEGPAGRTGENLNFCVGRPVKLDPPLKPIYILEEDVR